MQHPQEKAQVQLRPKADSPRKSSPYDRELTDRDPEAANALPPRFRMSPRVPLHRVHERSAHGGTL